MSDCFVYIGVKPCGHAEAICVDQPEYKNDTAKFLSRCVKDGYSIERVSRADGIARLDDCEHGTLKEQLKKREVSK